MRESQKICRYRALARSEGFTVVPLVHEAFGLIGPIAHRYFRRAIALAHSASGSHSRDTLNRNGLSHQASSSFWLLRLGMAAAMHRALASHALLRARSLCRSGS